jgi:hypothetical protein
LNMSLGEGARTAMEEKGRARVVGGACCWLVQLNCRFVTKCVRSGVGRAESGGVSAQKCHAHRDYTRGQHVKDNPHSKSPHGHTATPPLAQPTLVESVATTLKPFSRVSHPERVSVWAEAHIGWWVIWVLWTLRTVEAPRRQTDEHPDVLMMMRAQRKLR